MNWLTKHLVGALLVVQIGSAEPPKIKTVYEPLTPKELIEVVANYDIHKVSLPVIGNPITGYSILKGTTDYFERDIALNQIITEDEMRITILHEFRHAIHDKKGFSQNEDVIRDFSCRDYKLIYNKNCPNPRGLEDVIQEKYLK